MNSIAHDICFDKILNFVFLASQQHKKEEKIAEKKSPVTLRKLVNLYRHVPGPFAAKFSRHGLVYFLIKFIFQLENGTRRAQIPRKPLDPPISWIVIQSLNFDPYQSCRLAALSQSFWQYFPKKVFSKLE